MGCTQSTSDDTTLRFNGLEFSMTELSVAKRPGGPDVGPVRNHDWIDNGFAVTKPKTLPRGVITFSVVKVVADEDGAMFYHFCGTSAQDPTNEVRIAKRYSEFKTMHAEISELMANERNVPVAQQYLFETHPALPEMPKANAWTYLRGRYNDNVLEEREEQFTKILNAISRHPIAYKSPQFTKFLLA
ncbi:hypothetical protein P3T76_014651 [Phytophthora citrophthora]|uniref:PX domain-containing protein n=1 Tax=Phytophthora citrophthora TaxID=4793 RepID=A0AAD9G0X9_9STRA|nr:hypothetical protein P3T76_014651 [Phytophthora citrophthora]